jgi:hypothetical protein
MRAREVSPRHCCAVDGFTPRDGAIIFGCLIDKQTSCNDAYEHCGEHLMDAVLKMIIEIICAAVVFYILFHETAETMAREFETRIARLFGLARRTDG